MPLEPAMAVLPARDVSKEDSKYCEMEVLPWENW